MAEPFVTFVHSDSRELREAFGHQMMNEGIPQLDDFRFVVSPAISSGVAPVPRGHEQQRRTIHIGISEVVASASLMSAAMVRNERVCFSTPPPMLSGPRKKDRSIAQWKRERR